MKHNFLFFAVGLLFSQAYGQTDKYDTLTVKTIIYCDHCTECSSCQPHIEKYMSFEKGVKSCKVDVLNQTITVIYDPEKGSPQTMREAISKTGFDADEVKANAKAYAKLDECCKKK